MSDQLSDLQSQLTSAADAASVALAAATDSADLKRVISVFGDRAAGLRSEIGRLPTPEDKIDLFQGQPESAGDVFRRKPVVGQHEGAHRR